MTLMRRSAEMYCEDLKFKLTQKDILHTKIIRKALERRALAGADH